MKFQDKGIEIIREHIKKFKFINQSVSSVAQSCLTPWDAIDCSTYSGLSGLDHQQREPFERFKEVEIKS